MHCMCAQYGGTEKALPNVVAGREEPASSSQPDLLLFFIAAVTLRQRRRLIDECRDQVQTFKPWCHFILITRCMLA